jgi:hypothetical protein
MEGQASMNGTIFIELKDGVVTNVHAPERIGVVVIDHDAGEVDMRHQHYNERKLEEAKRVSPVEITP